MATERTLSIIKPDAVKNQNIGAIIARFESEGLRIAAAKKVQLDRREAEGFYAEHAGRGFFGELVEFMTSGPVVVMVLEGDDAIAKNRTIMGATNPANAAENTLRKLFAASVGENAVHGSDSPASAAREVSYFFGHARVEHDLKQKIAEFLAQVGHVATCDGIGDFVGFLDGVRRNRRERLNAVPFATALRIAQGRHDCEEPVER